MLLIVKIFATAFDSISNKRYVRYRIVAPFHYNLSKKKNLCSCMMILKACGAMYEELNRYPNEYSIIEKCR